MAFGVDLTGIEEARRQFGDDVINRSVTSTVNKVSARAATAAKKAIRAEYNIKAKDLIKRGTSNRNGIEVRRARKGQNEALILGYGGPLPLINFSATPNTVEKDIMRKRRRGVTIRVKKATGRKRLSHVFVAKTPSGHVGLFEREGKKRLPIEQKYGPGVVTMLKGNLDVIEQTVTEAAPVIFAHELEYQIMKARGEV